MLKNDLLTAATVADHLNTRWFGRSIEILDNTASTSSYLRSKAAEQGAELPEGYVVAALSQSGGRGRQSRTFSSPSGGLYFSLLLKPGTMAGDTTIITALAAVAVCRAVEELCGIKTSIKWVNDIYIGDKKLCGILTEGSIEGETRRLDNAVLGIGVNVNSALRDFPPEISDTVTTLREHTGNVIPRGKLLAMILNNFERLYDGLNNPSVISEAMGEYRHRMFILGREIEVISPAGNYFAVAVDVDDRGRLKVRTADGNTVTLDSGEVRVRRTPT